MIMKKLKMKNKIMKKRNILFGVEGVENVVVKSLNVYLFLVYFFMFVVVRML